jgi:iron complex outermembrane receptor protein
MPSPGIQQKPKHKMNPAKTGKTSVRSRLASMAVISVAVLAVTGTLRAQTSAPATAAEGEVVKLDPFTVTTSRDYGYRASNSIAGTRTDTPIKDIPINIQVFTRDLADDLNIKNQVDLEAYNASLVYGAADYSSDTPIQQPYQNFLFRGFRQNWGLRDGVREYDPIDMQNLARVEVVKGPAAALYGLAYPGGVMNNITKSVDFNRNFTSLRATVGSEGDYRGTIDANVSGALAGGKLGVRYNGTYEKTADWREHSEGDVRLSALIVDWQLPTGTDVEFLVEKGFRAKPNGLGWFTTGDSAHPASQASIPLQVLHPDVPWGWNWANKDNFDSLDTTMYRGKITQKIGDNFQVQAYVQTSDRLEKAGDGWDANGSGGANSWESAGSGWDAATNTITSTYNYRDWGNKMHAYGFTGVYKADFAATKHTFAFGANVWAEDELSRHSQGLNPLASAVRYPGTAGVMPAIPPFPPVDLTIDLTGGNGSHHENNSNDYYFANWQMTALDGKLKTNAGINKTNMKLLGWNNAVSPKPDTVYEASKVSPLYGAVYEVTNQVSVFAVHSTSLFPDTTKDSFGRTFSPQVGSSVEGGVKFETTDGVWSGTISYYNIKQTGGSQSDPNAINATTVIYDALTPAQQQAQYGGIRPLGDIIQGGEQKSKGIEVDVVYQPTKNWQIVGSFADTDHKFTKSAVASTIGQTYPQAIKTRYSLLTSYTITDGEMKGLKLGLGYAGGTKSLQDYQNFGGKDVARYWPSRSTLEVFGNYRFTTMGHNAFVQLNIKNLTKAPQYVGWQATGSNTVLATTPYEIKLPIVYRLTFGLDF